jgi:hypothetical protein
MLPYGSPTAPSACFAQAAKTEKKDLSDEDKAFKEKQKVRSFATSSQYAHVVVVLCAQADQKVLHSNLQLARALLVSLPLDACAQAAKEMAKKIGGERTPSAELLDACVVCPHCVRLRARFFICSRGHAAPVR